MLGTLIKHWRERQGLALEVLARDAQVALALLRDLEAERVETMDDSLAISRIADRLALPTPEAYGELCAANEPRRFRAYNVGLPKSGTTSLAGIFSAFRARHEFMARETWSALEARARGSSAESELRAFLRFRDVCGALELDSAGFHHAYVGLLVDEFPQARFIVTLRDAFSWLESLVEYALNAGPEGGEFVGWGRERLGLPFDLPYRDQASRERLRPLLPGMLDHLLDYWRDGNRALLEAVPKQRLLVVRTHEISTSLERIARFVGVAPEQLDRQRMHALRARSRPAQLRSLERGLLERLFADLGARDPVMREYFPDFSLATWLES